MSTWIAALPMYDWPEIRDHTDALWKSLSGAIAGRNIVAGGDLPDSLSRDADMHAGWLDPRLVIGQTCGLPYVTRLKDRVALLGSPAYANGNAPGSYCSVIIASQDAGDTDPFGWEGMRMAFNDAGSQSGVGAWLNALRLAGRKLPERFQPIATGSHRDSIRAVASGKADLAAIDSVTFELAIRHEPAVRKVHVVGRTPETPGLPFVASRALAEQAEKLREAISEAVATLSSEHRDGLLINGFVPRIPADYDGIGRAWASAEAEGWVETFRSCNPSDG